jgi:uncharacterized protein (TIGR00106 family)
MLFSVSMVPVGAGSSLASPVAEAVYAFDRAGLTYEVNGMSTVIEGDWEVVMPVIRAAERRLRQGHERVLVQISVDDREGAHHRLQGAVEDVERELGHAVPH